MKRPGITGPLILIIAGFILLADNLGFVPLSIWSILRDFWPVILILIGLDIIITHTESKIYYILGVLLSLIIIVGVASLAWSGAVPDSTNADLKDVNLKDKQVNGKFLIGTNLNEMNLEKSDFRTAVLIGVNMNHANLHDADFRDSLLIGVNLVQANLTDANLSDATLVGANLAEANLCGANIKGADFIGMEWKDSTICSD